MAAEHAPEIEELVRTLIDANRSGDIDTLARSTSTDPAATIVGSDASEVAHGHDEIVALLRGDMEQRRSDTPHWQVEDVEAYREGDVAWATILGPYPVGDDAIQARSAVVFHREDGEWKVVNWTFSFAVPNDALEPGSPVVAALAVAHV
jgi:ketosteroid isomerase-like protein